MPASRTECHLPGGVAMAAHMAWQIVLELSFASLPLDFLDHAGATGVVLGMERVERICRVRDRGSPNSL
jgi:hypothetical protein